MSKTLKITANVIIFISILYLISLLVNSKDGTPVADVDADRPPAIVEEMNTNSSSKGNLIPQKHEVKTQVAENSPPEKTYEEMSIRELDEEWGRNPNEELKIILTKKLNKLLDERIVDQYCETALLDDKRFIRFIETKNQVFCSSSAFFHQVNQRKALSDLNEEDYEVIRKYISQIIPQENFTEESNELKYAGQVAISFYISGLSSIDVTVLINNEVITRTLRK